MQIVSRLNHIGGGAQIPHRIITHCVAEFVDDGTQIQWAPDFETRIGLSAHYYVTPSGVIIQQREDHLMAWHAKGHNENTIGIEWMVPGIHDYESFLQTIKQKWVGEGQFNAGVALYKRLSVLHNIEANQRHSDVDPQRKKDPGAGFPWDQLLYVVGL